MIFKDHKNRSNIVTTLEYVFRASPSHGHSMDDVTFIQGSCMSASPLVKDQKGKVIDVDIVELAKEFQFQTQLYKGAARDGKLYTHTSLSIQRTEKLTDAQWDDVGNSFQEKMGFLFNEATFCFGLHKNSENHHIHIIASRVDNEGKLINQHNNWEKAQKATKLICEKFGLEVIPNSFDNILNENNDRTDRMKKQILRKGDKTKPGELKDVDVRAQIRKEISAVFKHDKPKTITDYTAALKKRGVIIKGVEGKIGECIGVKYSMPSLKDKYFAGSKISSSHASWGSLLNPQRKGLDYNPLRDNSSLGLSGVRVKVKVSKVKVSTIKRLKLNVVVRSYSGQYYADLAFKSSNVDLLLEAIMEVIMKILATLFGGSYVDCYTPLELSQSKIVHDTENENIYDASDVQECMQKVDSDTVCWLDDGSDPHGLCLGWDKVA